MEIVKRSSGAERARDGLEHVGERCYRLDVNPLLGGVFAGADGTENDAGNAGFDQMQAQIMAQAPAVPLYQPNVNSVFSKRTHGWYLHPVWIFDFLDYWLSR
jgi:hypothetical protein